MKLYEYQAKAIFKEHGIMVPDSVLVNRGGDVKDAINTIGVPCVLKSQVLAGGRGKAGLIVFAKDSQKAFDEAGELFERPEKIRSLLVEKAIDIDREIYVSITIEPVNATALLILSAEGGIDIETLAVEQPDKIITEAIDMREGLMSFQANHLAYQMGFEGKQARAFSQLLQNLYQVFTGFDCELVEINPLFVDTSGALIAGDGKLIIDDNALFRQTRFEQTQEDVRTEAEFEALQAGIPFIEFDGDIGLMCAGAGLTTTVYDLIHDEGGTVANYLEFGGPNYKKAVKAMEICLKVPSKVILIVTFGTIARADVMAEGIVEAIGKLKPDRPIVTCIRGTNEAAAVKMLEEAGLEPLFDTEEAVKKAVKLAKEAHR